MQQLIRYGIDVLLDLPELYRKKRLGLVTNDAATTSYGILSRIALINAGFNVVHLFSPEHGINRTGADGAAQQNGRDLATGLPVTSLYGLRLAPDQKDLEEIDLVLFDIPDIGCRFYTYLWTLTHVMEACAAAQVPLMVLDRPNPTGAMLDQAEGPLLDEASCASFIGRWAIPLRHSCTLGELASYFAATRIPGLSLEVIKAGNYRRNQTALQHFPFVPTSPAMQDVQTAMLYPGMGLLEGINVNEGRGTAEPFRICGAPFISAEELLEAFRLENIAGAAAEPIHYVPIDGVYAGIECHGLRLTVTDPEVMKPVALGIALLQSLFRLYPNNIEKRLYNTAANPSGDGHLDKLLGVKNAFEMLQSGSEIDTTVHPVWSQTIAPYLLYN